MVGEEDLVAGEEEEDAGILAVEVVEGTWVVAAEEEGVDVEEGVGRSDQCADN
jgi:hypothetical protein